MNEEHSSPASSSTRSQNGPGPAIGLGLAGNYAPEGLEGKEWDYH